MPDPIYEHTKEECEIITHLAAAWNLFTELPNHHPMAKQEFCTSIHQCQEKVMCRVAERCHPHIYPRRDRLK